MLRTLSSLVLAAILGLAGFAIVFAATPTPHATAAPLPTSPGGAGCLTPVGAVAEISPCSGPPGTKIGIFPAKTLAKTPNGAKFNPATGLGMQFGVGKTPVAGSPYSTVAAINLCDHPSATYKIDLFAGATNLGTIGQFAIDCKGAVTPAPAPPKSNGGCVAGYYMTFAPCPAPPNAKIVVYPLRALAKAPAKIAFIQNPPWFELDAPIVKGADGFTFTVPAGVCKNPTGSAIFGPYVDNFGEGTFVVSCPPGSLHTPTPTAPPSQKPPPPPVAGPLPACNDTNTVAKFTPCSASPGQTLAFTLLPKAGSTSYTSAQFIPAMNSSASAGPSVALTSTGSYQFSAIVPDWLCNQYNVGKSYVTPIYLYSSTSQSNYVGNVTVPCARSAPPQPVQTPYPGPKIFGPISDPVPGVTCAGIPGGANWTNTTPCSGKPGAYIKVGNESGCLKFTWFDDVTQKYGPSYCLQILTNAWTGNASIGYQITSQVVQIPADICAHPPPYMAHAYQHISYWTLTVNGASYHFFPAC